jgi:hypothetical protein
MRADFSTAKQRRNATPRGLVNCPRQGHAVMFYIINCREFLAFICLEICEILVTLDKGVINLSRGTNTSFIVSGKKKQKRNWGIFLCFFYDTLLVAWDYVGRSRIYQPVAGCRMKSCVRFQTSNLQQFRCLNGIRVKCKIYLVNTSKNRGALISTIYRFLNPKHKFLTVKNCNIFAAMQYI